MLNKHQSDVFDCVTFMLSAGLIIAGDVALSANSLDCPDKV